MSTVRDTSSTPGPFIADPAGLVAVEEKDTRQGESTPRPPASTGLKIDQLRLLFHLDRQQPGDIRSGEIARLYRTWRIRSHERAARRDLGHLARLGYLDAHGPDYRRHYTRTSKPSPTITAAEGSTS